MSDPANAARQERVRAMSAEAITALRAAERVMYEAEALSGPDCPPAFKPMISRMAHARTAARIAVDGLTLLLEELKQARAGRF